MKQQTFKYLGIVFLFMTASLSINAQTKWRYTYDNAGNRIQRVVVTVSGTRKMPDNQPNLLLDENGISAIFENSSKLRVETLGNQGSNVLIYDLSGRELVNERYETEVFSIDISALRKGIYILVVETNREKKSCKFNK